MLNNIKIPNQLSANQLIIVVSIYFTLVFNAPFLLRLTETLLAQPDHNFWFLCSIPILLLCILIIIFSLLSHHWLLKPMLITLTLISSLVFYGTASYGVVFDYHMIQNTFETDTAEAFSYLNWHFVAYFLLSGLLPALLIYRVRLKPIPFQQDMLQRAKLIAAAIIGTFAIAYFFYANYAAFGRNHRILKRYIIPTQYINSSVKYVLKNYLEEKLVFKELDTKPTMAPPPKDQKNLIVMVVGETARAQNFTYNGYSRETNAYSKPYELVAFQNMFSCGTATAVSVPCMFSALTKDNFDKRHALAQQNILDLAAKAGADVLWIDNNSGCKGVCERIETINIKPDKNNPLCDGEYCFDAILLDSMEHKLTNLNSGTTIIVLHMMGSHGPTYFRRYPAEHRIYTPDCPRSDIQNCNLEALTNTYDNTIAYTDFILASILKRLSSLPQNIASSMLYVSDHGESLGESGVYLHGLPYSFAPKEQTHIPMLVWLPQLKDPQFNSCLKQVANNDHFSHDNIFHSLLGLAQVKTATYDADMDMFDHCRVKAAEHQLILAKNKATEAAAEVIDE